MNQSSNPENAQKLTWWVPTFWRHRTLFGILCAVAAALAVGAGLASLWLPWFICVAFSGAAWVYGFLPALVFLIVFRRAEHKALTVMSAFLASFIVLLVLLVPANVAGYVLSKMQLRRSIGMANVIVRQLDDYRAAHERYPATLADLVRFGADVRIPPLATSFFYHAGSDGKSFMLRLPIPTDFMSDYLYESDERKWRVDEFD